MKHGQANTLAHATRFLVILFCAATALAHEEHKHEHAKKPLIVGVSSLDVWADGSRVHLLTVASEPNKPAILQYRQSPNNGEGFTEPIQIGQGQPPPDPIKRGADAQICASGDRVIAIWTTAGKEDRMGRGPLATAISSDGGKTWTPGPNPSDHPQSIGHAFIDIAADADGVFHMVWIDGRDRSGTGVAPTGKGLRYARSTDGGATWSRNRTLDAACCECCWNTIAVGPNGNVAVLYRDRDPRDMSIVRSLDSGQSWEVPTAVGQFNWEINACPHVGGGLAFVSGNGREKQKLIATVWTGKTGSTGAYTLKSDDGGMRWSEPLRLASEQSWHADIASNNNGEIAVALDMRTDDGQAIYATISRDGGQNWLPPRQLAPAAANATHPRVINTPTGFRVFWTETRPGEKSVLVNSKL